jgi:hypothetical protein
MTTAELASRFVDLGQDAWSAMMKDIRRRNLELSRQKIRLMEQRQTEKSKSVLFTSEQLRYLDKRFSGFEKKFEKQKLEIEDLKIQLQKYISTTTQKPPSVFYLMQ